jgi:hypothetical protein
VFWSEGGGDGIQRVKLDIESEVSGKAATKPIDWSVPDI